MRNVAKLSATIATIATIVIALLMGLVEASGRETSKTIAIDGTSFRPRDITISINDAVEWVNKDPFPHNVTSKAGAFQSGNLQPDGTWQFRPTSRGTFEYVCTLHPGMKAVLRVR
jgi:plastocyanin